MSINSHIVVVDDDLKLRNRLRIFLEKEGFRATAVGDAEALRRLLRTETPDLVIMDLQLPGEDGLSLTRHLRETSDIAVLILTGKGHAIDRVVGLEMGADDYLAKPFNLRELIARVKSVLRRSKPVGGSPEGGDKLRFGNWTIDFSAIELWDNCEEKIHLTSAEFRLLEVFVRNPGRTLSRDRLVDAMADRSWGPSDRSVDLHVSHLRKKLEQDPKRPELIKTVRGFGYVFAGEPRAV